MGFGLQNCDLFSLKNGIFVATLSESAKIIFVMFSTRFDIEFDRPLHYIALCQAATSFNLVGEESLKVQHFGIF